MVVVCVSARARVCACDDLCRPWETARAQLATAESDAEAAAAEAAARLAEQTALLEQVMGGGASHIPDS